MPSSRSSLIQYYPPSQHPQRSFPQPDDQHICKMQNCIIPRVWYSFLHLLHLSRPHISLSSLPYISIPGRSKCSRDLEREQKKGRTVSAACSGPRVNVLRPHIRLRGKSKFHARSFSMESNCAVMVTHRSRNAIVTVTEPFVRIPKWRNQTAIKFAENNILYS